MNLYPSPRTGYLLSEVLGGFGRGLLVGFGRGFSGFGGFWGISAKDNNKSITVEYLPTIFIRKSSKLIWNEIRYFSYRNNTNPLLYDTIRSLTILTSVIIP